MPQYGDHLSSIGKEALDYKDNQLARIRNFLDANPTEITKLADKCGESPEFLQVLITTGSLPLDKVISAYNAVEAIETAQKITAIRDYLRLQTSIIFELASETGISPEEIVGIMHSEKINSEHINTVYAAIQRMINEKAEQTKKKI